MTSTFSSTRLESQSVSLKARTAGAIQRAAKSRLGPYSPGLRPERKSDTPTDHPFRRIAEMFDAQLPHFTHVHTNCLTINYAPICY